MLRKLKLKFIVFNMVIVMVLLGVIFALIYHFTKLDMETQSAGLLQSLAQNNASIADVSPSGMDPKLPYFILQINTWGEVVVRGTSHYDLKDENFLQQLIQTVFTAQSASGRLESFDLLYARRSGLGYQRIIFVDISGQNAMLASLVQTYLLIGAISMLLFLLVSIFLANVAVRPVDKAWKQQKQFISDASHELKTPLAVIMSNAELLQNPDCEPEEKEQFTSNILTMSYQMRNLVGGLLELARADNGQVKKHFQTLDYSKLVNDALLPFEAVMFERGLFLETHLTEGIHVKGDAQYLGQVIDILIDNAQKYASAGVVEVCLTRQGRGVCLLTVSNPGTPIAQEDLERIFERFYRTDQARSRTGSFGLGLAIAKSVVTEHGGKIWARSNETGNCFFVQLPCM